ncbi:MAG: CSLREA domain-containing protein [Acidobacteriota bacterium]
MNRSWLPALLVLLSAPAAADVFVVTKTADTLDGACDADCSLREAVAAANARPGLDFIRIRPGTYGLTRVGPPEGANLSGDLDVRDDLVILGAGADRTVLDGSGIDRVLEGVLADADLEVRGVTVRNGRTDGPSSLQTSGGGIHAEGALTLVGCHVTGNRSDSFGGGAEATVLIARDTTFSDNEAQVGGGISSFFAVDLTNVTLSGNRALGMGGGAFLPFYSVDLDHVTITGNRAQEGGGIRSNFDVNCPGLCEVHFAMEASLIAGNTATEKGPDCWSLSAPAPGHIANLFGVADGCSPAGPDRAGVDPRLSPLGAHGGPTPTHALLAGSPAIDLSPSVTCSGADQRGLPRPADGDGNGLLGCDAGAVERSPGCQPDARTLCLGDGGRFQATARWTTRDGSGEAQAFPLTGDTGAFWFFGAQNLELQIKVLDGCAVNDRFWVFASGLTDVGVEITVEDTRTGASWMYGHQRGTPFPTVTDTDAFRTCSD